MGYRLEFNTILSVPDGQVDLDNLVVGQSYKITKPNERLLPLDIPIDLSDENYRFIAKAAVRKLTLTKSQTELEVEILKLFTPEESKVISDNFAKEA